MLMDGDVSKKKYGDVERAARAQLTPSQLFWMMVICAVIEVYTQTIIILLNVLSNKSNAYIIFAATNPPRLVAFIWISRKLCPHTWWRHYVTLDNLQLNALVIYVINGWMIATANDGDDVAGNTGWRSASIVLTPLLNVTFLGNFRIMVKHYPWTACTILIYKLLRCYAAIVITIVQLVLRRGSSAPVAGLDSGLLILYISQQVSFHVTLLSKIPSYTAYKRSKAAAQNVGLHAPLLSAVASVQAADSSV